MQDESTQLKRSLNLFNICFYGIGTIIGAGVYVLIGKVAAQTGLYLPFAFLLAGLIATFTALSYAELAARYPQSAGSAVYVYNAWQQPWVARSVGLMVVLTGVVSAATIANGFVGYLDLFVELPAKLTILGLLVVLALIAAWGINQSAWTVTIITLVELSGLVFVLYASQNVEPATSWPDILTLPEASAAPTIFLGAFLAFYAFIGFEDMVNVVEEVKNPKRNLPLAIILALLICTLLYCAVAVLAVRMMPIEQLAQSKAPLAEMVVSAGYSPNMIGAISLFAVINGALVQIIMASRLLYGLANKGLLPKTFAQLNRRTQTPIVATGWVALAILIFAWWLPLHVLAKLTSFIMLVIFVLVNLSLIVIKRRLSNLSNSSAQKQGVQYDGICFPVILPWIGLGSCLFLLMTQLFL